MTKQQLALQQLQNNPTLNATQLARHMMSCDPVNFPEFESARGIARGAVKKFKSGERVNIPVEHYDTSPQEELNIVLTGLSESDLRKKHDVGYIIKEAALRLAKGVYVPESEFLRQCNLRGQPGSRSAVENNDLKPYHGKAGGITYWSHPESIAKMKREFILT